MIGVLRLGDFGQTKSLLFVKASGAASGLAWRKPLATAMPAPVQTFARSRKYLYLWDVYFLWALYLSWCFHAHRVRLFVQGDMKSPLQGQIEHNLPPCGRIE
jgi:hypothetical protein